jgi:hypothetical protein
MTLSRMMRRTVMPKLEVPEIWAVQWFSGLLPSISNVPFDKEGDLIEMPLNAAFRYYDNLRQLQRARAMWELDERRNALLREIARKRVRTSGDEANEISQLIDMVADLQLRIDELDARGDAPLDDDYEALVNRPYGNESSEGQSGR